MNATYSMFCVRIVENLLLSFVKVIQCSAIVHSVFMFYSMPGCSLCYSIWQMYLLDVWVCLDIFKQLPACILYWLVHRAHFILYCGEYKIKRKKNKARKSSENRIKTVFTRWTICFWRWRWCLVWVKWFSFFWLTLFLSFVFGFALLFGFCAAISFLFCRLPISNLSNTSYSVYVHCVYLCLF